MVQHDIRRQTLYSRMIGIVTEQELARLGEKTVAVPGCGGVGFTHAEALARMGIGHFKIADFDTFGPENMNRQFGATIHTLGVSKVEVLRDRLLAINPAITVQVYDGVFDTTIDAFLDNVDMVCDSLDFFVMAARRLLHSAAYRRDIPVVMSCPVGFGAITHMFAPGGMTFDEFFDLHDGQPEQEMFTNFATGLSPGRLHRHYLPDPKLDFDNQTVSCISSSCLLATVQTATAVILTMLNKQGAIRAVPWVQQMDYMTGIFHQVCVEGGVKELKTCPDRYLA